MDTITFEIDNYMIQLVGDRVLIWTEGPTKEPDIDMSLKDLQNALSTASMLRK